MAKQRRGSGAAVDGALSAAARCGGRAGGLAARSGFHLRPSAFNPKAGRLRAPLHPRDRGTSRPSMGIGQIDWSAGQLPRALRLLPCKFNEAMGLRIAVTIEKVANVKPAETGFLFGLQDDHQRHRAGFDFWGDLRAQVIDDVETAIAAHWKSLHLPASVGSPWRSGNIWSSGGRGENRVFTSSYVAKVLNSRTLGGKHRFKYI